MGSEPEIRTKILRLIVVDPDPKSRRAITALLERRLGCDVAEAHGSMQALLLLRRGHFDGAVIELDMPEMDGRELLGRLARLFPQLPVGVLSREALAPGTHARFLVHRDESVESLLDAVRQMLGIEAQQSGIHSRPPKDD